VTTLAPALLARVLDVEPVARLAVLDDDGAPEVMPIVFARVGTTLFSPVDGKPKSHARLARLRHIEAHPRVALVVESLRRRLATAVVDTHGGDGQYRGGPPSRLAGGGRGIARQVPAVSNDALVHGASRP
jgi:hypothetical protein